jgi:protein phosphatase
MDLLLVADGMSSRPGGDVAARIAVDTVRDFFDNPEDTWPGEPTEELREGGERLVAAIALAHRRVRERAAALPHSERTSTTLAAVLGLPTHLWIAHVGNARVYRIRERRLERLTSDHCTGSDPRVLEWFTPEALVRVPPDAPSRALGLREAVEPEIRLEDLHAGDLVLLATDGLTKMVEDAEIAEVLHQHKDVATAVAMLIERANKRGGTDNVTAIVARWAW